MVELYEGISHILGLGEGAHELGSVQLLARAVTIYGATLVVICLGRNRFDDHPLGLDVILGFLLGSLVCRSLVSVEMHVQTAAAAAAMVVAHRLVSYAVARSRRDEARRLGEEPMPTAILATARTEPRVLEVRVAEGVQTVRIALDS